MTIKQFRIKRNFRFLFLLLMFQYPFSICCLGQQKIIDSLELVLNNKTLGQEEKLQKMILLGKYYIDENKWDKVGYFENLVSMANQQDKDKYKIPAYQNLAFIYSINDSITLSYYAIDTCYQYINKSIDTESKAEGLLGIAKIKDRTNDKTNVLDNLLNALNLAKNKKNNLLLTQIYYSLAQYYANLSDLENCSIHVDSCYRTALESKDKDAMMKAYRAKGFYYRKKYLSDKVNIHYLDSSITYLKKSLDVYKLNEGYISKISYLESLGQLISAYTYKNINKGSSTYYEYPDSVYKYSQAMLSKSIELNNIKYRIAAYRFLSGYENNQENYKKAENILLEAMKLVEDKEKYWSEKYLLSIDLCAQYIMEGDADQIFYYMDNAFFYQEQNFKQEYIREGKIAEAKYKVIEKEKQLETLYEKEKQQQRLSILTGLITIIIILTLAYISWLRLKNVKQREILLKKEKEEAVLLTQLKEEENRITVMKKHAIELEIELEKEKTKTQALEINRLQKEVIIGTTQLEYKNEMLETIKEKLNIDNLSENKDEIKRLLTIEKKADGYFDDFTESLRKIHPEFYSKLEEKAVQRLTPLDLKYCTYIFMNLSSKDIANILFVEPKTVRITKYRLKQKLGLGKEINLSSFIQNIISS